jgi:hypothetical protein
MASPSGTFQRPDLGMYFQALDLAAMRGGFIGLQIAKPFPVALQSANFSKFRAKDLLQRRETNRAPGGGYARQDFQFIQDSYVSKEYGAEEVIDRRERAMYAYTGIMQDLVAAERARDVVLREQEIRLADLLFSTSETDVESATMGTSAVTHAWSDASNSKPINDINTAVNAFIDQCGLMPNAIVMNDVTLRNFKLSAGVTDILKFSGIDDPKMIGPATLVDYFKESGIRQVLVGSARYNSANQGQAVTFSKVWSTDKVGLFRLPETMDLREPAVARTFLWTADGAGEGGTIEQYPWEPNRSDVIRCRIDCHEKLLYAGLGYILTNINGGTA